MRVYLDNCCFNRPYDNQDSVVVKLETEAKLYIQEDVKSDNIELAWSFVLDYENSRNPYPLKQKNIAAWRDLAKVDIVESEEVIQCAESFAQMGLRSHDALHIACAIAARCDWFITTDKDILRKSPDIGMIKIVNPVQFWELREGKNNEK